MAAGIVALLCLGGIGVIVSLYDEATKIERTAPDAVVDDFLGAYLVNRDDREAELYQCKSASDFSQLLAYRDDVVRREKEFSVGISFSWTSFNVFLQGAQGRVTTELIRTTSDQSGRDGQRWEFAVVDDDGWRVCGARPLP